MIRASVRVSPGAQLACLQVPPRPSGGILWRPLRTQPRQGHFQDLHLLTRMNVLLSWQLMLLLCATAFRETLEKVAPMENPRTTGSQLGPATLRAPWEQSPQCTAGKPEVAGPRPRGAALCPPESSAGPQRLGPCAPRSRLIPSPRGAVLVQREKDVSAYNWNSFGLRYGRRQAALPGSRSAARG
ncbi:metastasis-suppressor KiSS-1 isoform X2 [Bos javanicus]|uniref:metastasis-suppressor KiSS-1 isoform X2 n=1 Tax=Bos javanicus TaxID=9906 RepID=UPI002AA8B04C|nr:metastasis-suppressor KiSS-1 isoform X2 [Bos javanicus]